MGYCGKIIRSNIVNDKSNSLTLTTAADYQATLCSFHLLIITDHIIVLFFHTFIRSHVFFAKNAALK